MTLPSSQKFDIYGEPRSPTAIDPSGFNFGTNSFDPKTRGGGGGDFNFGATSDAGGWDWGGKGGANVAAGIQGVGSLANALMAYKEFQLGKQTLSQNKEAFNLNFANQAKVTNAQIEDKARLRALQDRSIAGDMEAIASATQSEYQKRKVSDKGIG